MNPLGKHAVKNHTYTQEEAKELRLDRNLGE